MGYSELRAGQGIALEHSAGIVRIHAVDSPSVLAETRYNGYLAARFDGEQSTVSIVDGSLPEASQNTAPAGIFLLDFLWRENNEGAKLRVERYRISLPTDRLGLPDVSSLLCIRIELVAGDGGFVHPLFGGYRAVISYDWHSSLPQNGKMVFYFPVARYRPDGDGKILEQLNYGILSGMVVESTTLRFSESSSSESLSSSSSSSSLFFSDSFSFSSGGEDNENDEENNDNEDNENTDKGGFYIVDQFIYAGHGCTGTYEGSAITRAILEYPYPECDDVYIDGEFFYSLHTVTLLGPYPSYEEAELHRGDPV
jgi:hypothetical protein